jgi:hypothetical protein
MPVVRFTGSKLDPATIKALVTGTLVNGSKPTVWWNRQSIDFRNSFMDTMRTSMRNGESLTQAITRVVGGTVDGVSVPGIMKTTKAKAGALAATAQSAVSNEAALKTFQANNDVIKAVSQVSTLDNKTSDICVAYSGQTWNINTLAPVMGSSLPFNGGPPRHFNCRSRLRPVTMSFKELGVDAAEIPAGTRASMNGQVPSDITFNQFLKNKGTAFQDDLLGPARARLWRDGDITLTQLVDMRGNPLRLSQLEELAGIKPKPKFNPATSRMIDAPKKPTKKLVDSFLDDVKITEIEHAEITGHAKRLVKGADAADDLVTQSVKSLADDIGAKFPDAAIVEDGPLVKEGSLHWRKKDLESTSRKIQTYARDRNISFTEASDQISDSLRYTYVLDEDDYVRAIQEAMEKFAELGYKNNKFDPAWLLRPDYKGLNINLVSPQGVRIELQFHTAKSFEVKNGINHTLYEKFRKLSKADQKGTIGQGLQAEMLANAQAIPVPKNIKFLEDLADIYNKPDVAKQTKIFAQAKARQLEAVEFAKVQQFNSVVSARLTEGNLKLARSFIDEAVDIPKKVKKSALARIEQVRKTAEKEADALIKEKGFAKLASKEEFNAKFLDVLDEIDESGLSQATRLEVTDKLKKLKLSKVEDFATEDLLFHQVMGNFDEAAKVAATIKNPSPKFRKLVKELEADHITSVEKKVRLALENGNSDDAIKELLKFGDTELKDAPTLRALHKEIQSGSKIVNDTVERLVKADAKDFDEWTALVKKEINESDIPNWMRNKILNDPKFAAAEESANFKPIVTLGEKTLIEGDLDKVKELLDSIPLQIKGRSKLSQAFMTAKQKQADIIKIEFPKKVKAIATEEFGFTVADLELLSTSVDDLAVLMKGVVTDSFKDGLKASLTTARVKLRAAMDQVKALNKSSKGVNAITEFANSLEPGFAQHAEFQKVIQKAVKQAKTKASAARKEVLDRMIKEGVIDADDIITFGDNVLKEAFSTVNKKLGKQQMNAKIVEIKSKLANAKKQEVSIAEFTADPTKYDEQVLALLDDAEMKQLKEAVERFKNVGAESSNAKSNMIQVLQGKSAKQVRAIKEYVHKRVNAKTLPSGANFDAKVAEIVTKHVNNVDRNVIRAHIDAMTKGADINMKLNFEQTIFTRAGVKNFEELGIVVEGSPTSNVITIRKALKIDDPGNTPIPTHTAAERMKAAKTWMNSKNLPDDEFKKQQLRSSKSLVANGKGQIQAGDKIFGENAWGITPQQWQKWVDDVAPTLEPWDVALINQYTGGMAGRMNAGLYDGGVSFDWTAGARALNAALDKMPKHTGTVYRGTSSRSNWSADYIDARYNVGETVIERGFGSSSAQTSSQFNGNLKFIIKTKGKNAAIIGHIGQYGTQEMEVLFKAGTKFKVIKKTRSGSGITVWMEEI